MWTTSVPPAPSVPVQESTFEVIAHASGPVVFAASIVQVIPGPVGSASCTRAPDASPAPVLPAVTVKPIDVPALTGPGSAVLVIDRFGHFTCVLASAVSVPVLLAVSVAVLLYVAQL